jgi:nitrite reductase (cytochrome c-552)
MAFIRHPEFEFFTNQSPHFQGGLSCADCHMPYKRVGSNKISDHNMTSPLKNDMRACMQCHTSTAEEMRNQVLTIQDRTISMMQRPSQQNSSK